MAALTVLSGNQLQAVSGRKARPVAGELAEAATADLPSRRAYAQRMREMELQDRELALKAAAQEDAAEAQQRGQTQQMVGAGISTVGQTALLAKTVSPNLFGLLGPSTASTATAAAPVAASAAETGALTAGATTAEAVGASAASAGASSASSLSGPIGATLGGGVAGGIGAGLAGAGIGYGAGKLIGLAPGKSAGARAGKAVGSAAVGAVGGFLVGGPIGAIAGGLLGGLSGGGVCIIHEAGYGKESCEVDIARKFRNAFLSTAQLRAYYKLYEDTAEEMLRDTSRRDAMRRQVTDRLVRYGAAVLGMPYKEPPSLDDVMFAQEFLKHLSTVGKDMGPFTRRNGEVI